MITLMRYTKDLEESGFSKKQANIVLKVLDEIMIDNFCTKKDLELTELRISSRIDKLENQLCSVQDKIIIKLSAVMVVLFGIALTIFKL